MKKLIWVLDNQFGINPYKFLKSFRGIIWYIGDLIKIKKVYKGKISYLPCLIDKYAEGGSAKSEYFIQDLFVARKIFNNNPNLHYDLGSRVDGFISNVATFTNVKVFDIRPISSTIENIEFEQLDIMNSNLKYSEIADSLSCLHTIEHFGLGRYGDIVDINGLEKGLVNLGKLLKPNGIFYLSTPIGQKKIVFNAHRISNPKEIIELAKLNNLELIDFAYIKNDELIYNNTFKNINNIIQSITLEKYVLGIFIFKKNN
jgi:hypothetical protein